LAPAPLAYRAVRDSAALLRRAVPV
jgi:hypothetical protein